MIEADEGGAREATGPMPVGRERVWLGSLAAIFRTGPRFKGQRFVELVERAQINEALSQGRDTRFVVQDGSVLADLLADVLAGHDPADREREARELLLYLVGEKKAPVGAWWRTIRRAPEIWLINTFNLTRAPVPELLVRLDLPVSQVMERLRSEGRPLAAYQTESGLERLQEAYRETAELLRRRRKIRVLELDLASMDVASAAGRIEDACVGLAGAKGRDSD